MSRELRGAERYSLINVFNEHDGYVDGNWIQDFSGSFEKACRFARETEKINSNRLDIAVVEKLSGACPNYYHRTGLKRLDKKG